VTDGLRARVDTIAEELGIAPLMSSETLDGIVAPDSVAVLAERIGDDVVWVILAGGPRALADAEVMSEAFVWPSFARRQRLASIGKWAPELAAAISRLVDDRAIALRSPAWSTDAAAASIKLMLEVRGRRPARHGGAPRAIGRILRDVDLAAERGQPDLVEELVREAVATGRLTLMNEAFLEVRVRAAAGAWHDVLSSARRNQVAQQRRIPRAVEHDLVRAIGANVLAEHRTGGAPALIEAFRDSVEAPLQQAFRDHRNALSPDARLAWMTRLASTDLPFPATQRDEILHAAAPDEHELLRALAAQRSWEEGSLEVAAELLAVGEDAAAWAAAADAAVRTLESAAAVLDTAATRIADPERSAEVARVAGAQGQVVPASWREWLAAIVEQPGSDELRAIAAAQGQMWTARAARDPALLKDLAELIEVVGGDPAVRGSSSQLAIALLQDEVVASIGSTELGRTLCATATAISVDPGIARIDLEILVDVLERALDGSIDEGVYRELCHALTHGWSVLASPRLAGVAVDAARVLVEGSSRDRTARDRTLAALAETFASDVTRRVGLIETEIVDEMRELLDHADLASLIESGTTDQDGETATEEPLLALNGRAILLHTLMEGAGRRAGEVIAALATSARVQVDASLDGSARLRDQARSADLVIISTRSTKHAASEFIERHAGGVVRAASGKGWSSIVSAARRAAGELL
jgi:hypothetical protein